MHKPIIASIGILLAIALLFHPSVLLLLILFTGSIIWIKYGVKTASRNFLLTIFIVGFVLRVVLSLLNYYLPLGFGVGGYRAADTQPDAITYNGYAVYVAETVSERDFSVYLRRDPWLNKVVTGARNRFKGAIVRGYQMGANVMLLGMFYSWIGYAPIVAKILNGIVGAFSAILIYCISRKLLKIEWAAKLSAALTMFFPSLAYWSSTLLQDTFSFFLFLLYVLYALIFFIYKKKLSLLFALLISGAMYLIKPKFLYLVAIADIFLIMLLCYELLIKGLRRRIKVTIILSLFVFLILQSHIFYPFLLRGARKAVLTHSGFAGSSSELAYRLYPERFYDISSIELSDILSPGYVFIVLKSIFYFMFSPFPWEIPTKNMLIFYPQIILTFMFIPFVIRGILIGLRHNFKTVLFMVILLSIFLIPLSLASGISGITFRHKDLFIPIFLIFFSFGVSVNRVR